MTVIDYTDWQDEALVSELEQLVGTYTVGRYVDGRAVDALKKEILRRMKKDLTNGG